jgi:sugar/nucleoside kinase (ribokinase family)
LIRVPGSVLCAGNLTQDILAWPVDDVVFDTTIWVRDIITSIGGNGANTAFAISRLGGSARLIGSVGRDVAGDNALSQLREAGVDVRVSRCDLPTPVSVVIVRSDGARCFLHRPGASREAFCEPIDFSPELIEGCTHFHLANPFSMARMRDQAGATLASARAAGLSTSLDTGWDALGHWMDVIGPCLPHLDLLFVNEDEAERLSGQRAPNAAATFFRDHGVASTVIKLGAQGSVMFDGVVEMRIPGFVVEAVDSTGAGDCFAGAFLAGLQRSMSPAQAAQFANAAGALNVQRPGATTGLLDYEGTMRWMQSHT